MLEVLEVPKVHNNIYITAINRETNKIKYRWCNDIRTRTSTIYRTKEGRFYFNSCRKRFYIDEFGL